MNETPRPVLTHTQTEMPAPLPFAPKIEIAPAEVAAYLRVFVDASPLSTLLFDSEGHVLYANPAAVSFAKSLSSQDPGKELKILDDWHPDLVSAEALGKCSTHGHWTGEVLLNVPSLGTLNLTVQMLMLGPEQSWPCGLRVRDISADYARQAELHARNADLEIAYAKLNGVQEKVVQSEKLASIGQLAAGVAHEINNPIGYINSNLSTLQHYAADLLKAVGILSKSIVRSGDPAAIAELEEARRRLDLDFMSTDLEQLLSESREGINRVCKIVQDLKEFSRRNDNEDWVLADIHKGLESTLNIASNELKYKAEVIRTFDELPLIECLPSELNQVFLNILLNAGHAIKEQGLITVSTGCSDEKIWIAIGDDGEGIPPEILPRIFDPFFTSKPVGVGTGLGLAISYGIVTKHHGKIEVTSVVGQGTLFRIELPILQPIRST